MPHINLLPWREELRKQRQKEFAIIAGAAVAVMGVVVLLVHLQFSSKIDYQNSRNDFLSTQISTLDKKIQEIKGLELEKRRLIDRMEAIQTLQASRPEIVHLLDELVATMPDGIYYIKVEQKNKNLTLTGVAQSNARVSSLMRNLESSQWLKDPALVEIKALPQQKSRGGDGGLKLSQFTLRVVQETPKKMDMAGKDEG